MVDYDTRKGRAVQLEQLCEGVHTVRSQLRLGPGFSMPVSSTVLTLPSGGLAVVSPLAFDEDAARAIDALGAVEHLIAPNRLHHLFLGHAAQRWPGARVWGAPGLSDKRRDLSFDQTLGQGSPPSGLTLVVIEGAPALSEVAILHQASRTLVLTDLVFHVRSPRGLLTGLILRLVGAHGRLAQSRAVRFMARDRAALATSARALLALDFERLLVAHGDPVLDRVKERLSEALGWMLAGGPPLLPAAERGA